MNDSAGDSPDAAISLDPYFRYPREDVVAVVPARCRRILDLGCAAGLVGRALKRRGPCEVIGVERDPRAAAAAREALDVVLELDLEAPEDPLCARFGAARFDALIYADILEHLLDPWATLARQRHLLEPGGALIVSLPNVRHYPVVAGLLRGRWSYQREGVLDRTHLRFFTLASALELITGAGYEVVEVHAEIHASRGMTWLGALSFGLLRGFLTRQHVIVATNPKPGTTPPC